MKRLLITGASGFVGWNLCRAAAKGWDVFGAVFRNGSPIEHVHLLRADFSRLGEIKALLQDAAPDAVIHTAALSQPNYCQLHRDESRRINVESTKALASLCAARSIPFVFTSTDLVFDGRSAPYAEDDEVCPVSIYGEQKVEAESAVLDAHPGSVVCRMSIMYGDSGPGAASFIQGWIEAMKGGRELRLFADEYRTFLSAVDAAEGLLLALTKARGLLHLGGPERASRLEFGRILRNVLRLPSAPIVPCSLEDSTMPAPRPRDVALNIGRAKALGFRPGGIERGLRSLAATQPCG